jgi:cytochrome P450
LIANDPQRQDQARTEIQNNVSGKVATGDDVKNLPFLRQIIEETLRLYPPAALVSRTAMATDMLCERHIQKGDTVIIPIYALHRHQLLWQDPDAFTPERFADLKKLERYAYLPFGDGPLICIGSNFAMNEAIIILASLLKSFRFNPVSGCNPTPEMILTLRPAGGVWLTTETLGSEPNPRPAF